VRVPSAWRAGAAVCVYSSGGKGAEGHLKPPQMAHLAGR
jgi:hypothetical protein